MLKKWLSVLMIFLFLTSFLGAVETGTAQTGEDKKVTTPKKKKKVKKVRRKKRKSNKKKASKKKAPKKKTAVKVAPKAVSKKTVAKDAAPKGKDKKAAKVKLIKKKKKMTKVKAKKFEDTYVYKDAGYKGNMYIATGWMGDYGDLRLSSRCFVKPKKGLTCIKISYSAKQSQGAGWAGIYWQHPANNWGIENKGLNLKGAKKLTFYIKGEKGGEVVDELKVGGISGTYPDTSETSFGPILLSKKWKKYSIDLENKDLRHIIGGFAFVVTAESNPDGIIFYLDEVVFV